MLILAACFDERGRRDDPARQEVHVEQAGLIWGVSTPILAVAALWVVTSRRRRE
jgi:hypothetical protein